MRYFLTLSLLLASACSCGQDYDTCNVSLHSCPPTPPPSPDHGQQGSDAGTPAAGTVYVSYNITNQDSTRKFCDVTMDMPDNSAQSGAYYSYYLDPGDIYGGYHVNWGPAPYRVTFKVGCWLSRETPEDQRVYTVTSFTLMSSTEFKWVNTPRGVQLTDSVPTL